MNKQDVRWLGFAHRHSNCVIPKPAVSYLGLAHVMYCPPEPTQEQRDAVAKALGWDKKQPKAWKCAGCDETETCFRSDIDDLLCTACTWSGVSKSSPPSTDSGWADVEPGDYVEVKFFRYDWCTDRWRYIRRNGYAVDIEIEGLLDPSKPRIALWLDKPVKYDRWNAGTSDPFWRYESTAVSKANHPNGCRELIKALGFNPRERRLYYGIGEVDLVRVIKKAEGPRPKQSSDWKSVKPGDYVEVKLYRDKSGKRAFIKRKGILLCSYTGNVEYESKPMPRVSLWLDAPLSYGGWHRTHVPWVEEEIELIKLMKSNPSESRCLDATVRSARPDIDRPAIKLVRVISPYKRTP